jgi:hypothetical protein
VADAGRAPARPEPAGPDDGAGGEGVVDAVGAGRAPAKSKLSGFGGGAGVGGAVDVVQAPAGPDPTEDDGGAGLAAMRTTPGSAPVAVGARVEGGGAASAAWLERGREGRASRRREGAAAGQPWWRAAVGRRKEKNTKVLIPCWIE